MEDTNTRIKTIREALGMNQTKFAERLSVVPSLISKLEGGVVILTEQNIKLICLAFNINETWLRTGEGYMFTEEAPGEGDLLETFRQLSPIMRKTALKILSDILVAQEEAQEPAPDL